MTSKTPNQPNTLKIISPFSNPAESMDRIAPLRKAKDDNDPVRKWYNALHVCDFLIIRMAEFLEQVSGQWENGRSQIAARNYLGLAHWLPECKEALAKAPEQMPVFARLLENAEFIIESFSHWDWTTAPNAGHWARIHDMVVYLTHHSEERRLEHIRSLQQPCLSHFVLHVNEGVPIDELPPLPTPRLLSVKDWENPLEILTSTKTGLAPFHVTSSPEYLKKLLDS